MATAATQLVFSTAPQTIPSNTCSAVATVQAHDALGNPTTLMGAATLTASPSTGVTFHADGTCGVAVTSVTFTGATASFHFRGAQPLGTVQLMAQAGVLSALQTEQISPLPLLAVGDARVVYGRVNAPELKQRHFTPPSNIGAPTGVPVTTGPVRWVVDKPSPNGAEELVAVLTSGASSTTLTAYQWANGAWSTAWGTNAISAANATRRGFDVEYEHVSGDALAVHGGGLGGPQYRTRTNGTWSAASAVPVTAATVVWLELERRPGTNEIALAYVDSANDLGVIVWDGDAWSVATNTSLEADVKTNPVSMTVSNRAFDVAWEQSTGALVVAWGREGAFGFWWARRSPGQTGSWSAAANVPAPGAGIPHALDLASEPGTARIAAAVFDMGDGTERLGLATWSGAAWVGGEYDSQAANVNDTATGDLPGAVAWVGDSGVAVAMYADNDAGSLDWARWSGTDWSIGAPVMVGGKGFTESTEAATVGTRAVFVFSDSNGQLFGATYDGNVWAVSAVLETALHPAVTSPFGLGTR